MSKLITAYENAKRSNVTFHTLTNYDEALYRFFGDFPGIERPEEVWLSDVEAWSLQQLAKGYTLKSTKYRLGVLGSFYNWLTAIAYVPKRGTHLVNPFAHLKLSKLVDLQARPV